MLSRVTRGPSEARALCWGPLPPERTSSKSSRPPPLPLPLLVSPGPGAPESDGKLISLLMSGAALDLPPRRPLIRAAFVGVREEDAELLPGPPLPLPDPPPRRCGGT